MKLKKHILLIALTIAGVTVSGCSPAGESKSTSVQNESTSSQETINTDLEWYGDHLLFGTTYGSKKIEWQVLDTDGDKALVLSSMILDAFPYDFDEEETTWETSSVREYLNGEFYQKAFDDEERKYILETKVSNPDTLFEMDGEEDTIDGGNDTEDRIFLLSRDELEEYFSDDSDRAARPDPQRLDGIRHGDNGRGWWFLRSPGFSNLTASAVDENGSIQEGTDITADDCGIRPAMWVKTGRLPDYAAGKTYQTLDNGNIVFGNYNNEPVEWRILDRQEGKALIISDKVLESRIFDPGDDVTWESSDMRSWLNHDFYDSVFTSAEKEYIQETENVNPDGYYEDADEVNTNDNVFLLSLNEAEKYFPDDESREADATDEAAYRDSGFYFNSDTHAPWWLRTLTGGKAGDVTDDAYMVNTDGYVDQNFVNVNGVKGGVRPAMWIQMDD